MSGFNFSQGQKDHTVKQLEILQAGREKHVDDPRLWEIDYNEALIRLANGDLEAGWKMFPSRFELPRAKFKYEFFPVERWNGESLAGKDVFYWLEQGIGDQIMGASMIPDLIKAVGDGSITLLCDRVLVPIMRRTFPGIHIHKTGEPLSRRLEEWDFDFQLSMSDVGQMFRLKWDDFPGTPFLKADPAMVKSFRKKYENSQRLVGIAWSSVSVSTGSDKSMSLAELEPILTLGRSKFIDMQYGDHFQELWLAQQAGLRILYDPIVDQLIDMDKFFAQVAAMDMVVTTSNTLAHVAGSLGIPTYVMLPLGKGRLWYWYAEISDSPWYKSVSLFRQEAVGDWSRPIREIRDIINNMNQAEHDERMERICLSA